MILCCGEALIDMIPNAHGSFHPCPGGSPYNTAIAIARLNVPAAFLGRLSTDFFGEILIQRLRQNQVREEFIIRSGEHSTLAFVKLDAGAEPQYVFYTEGSADRSLSPADIPPALPPEIRGILFGSIALTLEPAASSIESLIRREAARGEAGPLISFDPNVRPFMIPDRDAYVKRFESWASLAHIAKVSAQDYDFIYPGLGLEPSMRRVLSLGPRLAVSTLGPKGALALLKQPGGGLLRVTSPAIDLPVADTIGAGDTFHGALLAWLERRSTPPRAALAALTEGELADALRFANKAASLVCSRKGAEPPSLAEVETL
ncbi:MAG: carbohydrate kinase [Treponema sp.]|jgi:fructokinase|nr:carbohydrate kinase [Treponema sp.]